MKEKIRNMIDSFVSNSVCLNETKRNETKRNEQYYTQKLEGGSYLLATSEMKGGKA